MLEICGDGLNLGSYECDDGNTKDGDGCSSKCKIENGYECIRQRNGPDICKSTSALSANLEVRDNNNLRISFTSKAISVVNSILKLYSSSSATEIHESAI